MSSKKRQVYSWGDELFVANSRRSVVRHLKDRGHACSGVKIVTEPVPIVVDQWTGKTEPMAPAALALSYPGPGVVQIPEWS